LLTCDNRIMLTIRPVNTINPYFFNGKLSMYLPDRVNKNAETMVTDAYIVPKPAFEMCNVSIQWGTNNEMKKVWPKEEKKLKIKPKFNNRLLLPTNLNQFLMPSPYLFVLSCKIRELNGQKTNK
jgi:hypothetical protein